VDDISTPGANCITDRTGPRCGRHSARGGRFVAGGMPPLSNRRYS